MPRAAPVPIWLLVLAPNLSRLEYMSTPPDRIPRKRGGGGATVSGVNFQIRVAAYYSVRVLAERNAEPLWSWPVDSTLEFVRCETEQPVDDIMVGNSSGAIAYAQVKHSVSIDKSPDSALAKALDQFVRQFLKKGAPGSQWDGAFVPGRDRLILAVGRDSPARVTKDTPDLLEKIRASSGEEFAAGLQLTKIESDILATLRAHVERAWAAMNGINPTSGQLRNLLASIWIDLVDVDVGGVAEREAKELLRRSVLVKQEFADAAWGKLLEACTGYAKSHSGGGRTELRSFIERVGASTLSPPSYLDDIQRLRRYSEESISSVGSLAEIRVGERAAAKVDRDSTHALRIEAENGSLLVIGEPGAGKTGALHDLASELASGGRDVVFIVADRPQSTSLPGFSRELQLQRSFQEVLDNWQGPQAAFLITDALDAARSEYAASMFRDLIEHVLRRGGRWRVIASIRKFDLRYNTPLRNLFAGSAKHEFLDPDFGETRHFSIPPLSDGELSQFGTVNPQLGLLIDRFVAGGDPEVRKLIRVLFNVRLLSELLTIGASVDELTPIKTQTELLERYWRDRIIQNDRRGDAREGTLRRVVLEMMRTRTLRASRSKVIEAAGTAELLPELLSLGIIQEPRSSPEAAIDTARLAFSHHILFDYAAARLVFRQDPTDLAHSVAKDKDLVVAFRPSLGMHFRHVWESGGRSRAPFWDLVFVFNRTNGIPRVGKIIGPAVAAELTRELSDFEPLFIQLRAEGAGHNDALEIVRHLIGSLAAGGATIPPLSGEGAPPWAAFAASLSETLPGIEYAVRLLLSLLTESKEGLTDPQCKAANTAARALLTFALADPESYDGGLVRGGLEAVCRTYRGDPASSSALLRHIVDRDHARLHGHAELPFLCNEAPKLWAFDPDLIEELFRVAFEETQKSEETTSIGPKSRILGLNSNVRQDWQHVHYSLGLIFEKFLAQAPFHATRALIAVIAAWSKAEHPRTDPIEKKFEFLGVECVILTDYSQIWDSGRTYGDTPVVGMLHTFQQRLESLPDPELGEILLLLAKQNRAAVMWKRLLQSSAENPKRLGVKARSLLWQAAILTSYDTSHPARALIKSIYGLIDREERLRIEKQILALAPDPGAEETAEHNYNLRDLYINSIPEALIATEELRQLHTELRAKGNVRPDVPFTVGDFEAGIVSNEEFLRVQGIPVDDQANREWIDLTTPLREFVDSRVEKKESIAPSDNLFDAIQRIHAALQAGPGENVHHSHISLAEAYLAKTCALLAGDDRIQEFKGLPEFIRDCLLEIAGKSTVSDPVRVDPRFEDFPSWGSPNASVDSATGILALVGRSNCEDRQLTDSLRRLCHCDEPATRLEIATNLHLLRKHNLAVMWEFFERMAAEEMSIPVLINIVSSLGRFQGPRALTLVDLIFKRVHDAPGAATLRSNCFGQYLHIYLTQDGNRLASERLEELLSHPSAFAKETGHLLHNIRSALTLGPADGASESENRIRLRAIEVVRRILTAAMEELKAIAKAHEGKSSKEVPESIVKLHRTLHEIIDSISNQIYFASGAFSLKTSTAEDTLDDARRRRFMRETSDILDLLTRTGVANVAFHLTETLASLIEFDPARIFIRIRDVIVAAKEGGFQFEMLAVNVVVKTVEQFLATHADILRDDAACRNALVDILDTFVEAGWPSAQQLTYRLAEIYR